MRATGVVFDSLVTRRPLAGATVTVEGTARTAVTDSAGAFRLDSLPASPLRITFAHPLLDSLGLGAPVYRVAPDPTRAGAAGVQLRMTVPSGTTLRQQLCAPAQGSDTAVAVLLGTVRDAVTRAPMANARVSVGWTEWAFAGGRVRQENRESAVTTDAEGQYVACGVPNDVPVVLRARLGADSTGEVWLDPERREAVVQPLVIASRVAAADGASGAESGAAPAAVMGVVQGVVRSFGRSPLAGARVLLAGNPASAVVTDSAGRFRLPRVPAGSQTIEVRVLGVRPHQRVVVVQPGGTTRADLQLQRGGMVALSEVVVRGKRVGAVRDYTGFDERRQRGVGRFFTQEDIEQRLAQTLPDIFRGLPNAQVLDNGGGQRTLYFARSGGLCFPMYYVDGIPMQPMPGRGGGPEEFLNPNDVRGIEVYTDATSVPAQYARNTACGVVVIWTKRRAGTAPR